MIPTAQQVSAFLDGLLADLYRRDGAAAAPSPLPVIDDPALARRVLARPDVFVKNYDFLEDLARGRFSSNGEEWRLRAAATRHWYRAAHKALAPPQVRQIYARHLAGAAELDARALFQRYAAASVEVFSRSIGLAAALPWPVGLADRLRELLQLRQWIDWNFCAPATLRQVQDRLAELRGQLGALWQASPEGRAALAELAAGGAPCAGFDAAEELLQHVLAASETTASSLMWATEALSQQAGAQRRLAADPSQLQRFIAEVLRLFPPTPLLTRRCVAAHQLGGMSWQPGQVLSISIVGIQRHPGHWRAPWQFDPDRPEFDADATPFAYMPFSRGERVCAGMRLAMLELRAGLEALLDLYHCAPGPTPTAFGYGMSSFPRTSLRALRRDPAAGSATGPEPV